VIFGPGGDPSGIVGVSQDVTEEVHRQAELARIGAQREAILDAAGEGVCGLDPNGLVTFANPAAARILGTTVEEIVGSPFSIRLARMANGSLLPHALIDRIREGEPLRDDNACLRRADGGEVPAGLMCTPLWDADRIAGAVATFDDATSRKQFEAQLQYLADHDPLTGLQNRRRFEDTTQELCTYSARYGAQLSMLLLDLDHFKDVNDTKPRGPRRAAAVDRDAVAPIECVEDVATVEMLRNFGVDFVQGFHIGEPGLIEDVLPRLSPEPRYTPRSAAVTGA
jgi:PAS domain S-box-containing protein